MRVERFSFHWVPPFRDRFYGFARLALGSLVRGQRLSYVSTSSSFLVMSRFQYRSGLRVLKTPAKASTSAAAFRAFAPLPRSVSELRALLVFWPSEIRSG